MLPRALPNDPVRVRSSWWGSSTEWILPFEGAARRRYGTSLHRVESSARLTYTVELPVIGRDLAVPVRIEFHRYPDYLTYGLKGMDYPRVFADKGTRSPHRMPDDSLCLYYPGDPADRRWTAEDGLDELLNLTARHLFAEEYWRENHAWPFEEAPHGYRGAA
jgi:hypothetical protein